MRPSSLLLATALAACGTTGGGGVGDPPASCKLDDVLAADLAGEDPWSCGDLDIDADTTTLHGAQSCVLEAIQAQQPFLVTLEIRGIDSRVARAFYGRVTEAGLALSSVAYDGDPHGGGGENQPRTTTSSCATLTAAADCSDSQLAYSLCLACASPAVTGSCDTP